jgi:hypothetical protein
MHEINKSDRLIPIFIKLPPEHIVSIKSIIEGYEGLGIVRTLNPQTGEVVILALEGTVEEVHKILEDIRTPLNLRIIPIPPSADDDWLLAGEDAPPSLG